MHKQKSSKPLTKSSNPCTAYCSRDNTLPVFQVTVSAVIETLNIYIIGREGLTGRGANATGDSNDTTMHMKITW